MNNLIYFYATEVLCRKCTNEKLVLKMYRRALELEKIV